MDEFARPRKSLGQNFLEDANIIRKIVASLSLSYDDIVLEIGPGRGALTELLLEQCAQLHVVEFDRDLIVYWQSRAQAADIEREKLVVHAADILNFDLDQILETVDRPIKVIGNLPYNISSPVLFHLMNYAQKIDYQVLMLQKEVIDRLASTSGNKQYGRLSVMMQQRYRIERLFDVSAKAFNPPPKVESAIALFTPLKPVTHQVENDLDFSKLVKQAFSMRRKTLRNNLKGLLDSEQIKELDIDPSVRAEMLEVADFVILANRYSQLT